LSRGRAADNNKQYEPSRLHSLKLLNPGPEKKGIFLSGSFCVVIGGKVLETESLYIDIMIELWSSRGRYNDFGLGEGGDLHHPERFRD